MIIHRKDVDAFSDSGSAKSVGTSWTYGSWQTATDFHTLACISYEITATTQPTKLEARIELSSDDGTTNRGPVHLINFVSGGVIDVDDAVWDLPVGDTDPHMFETTIRAGYAWRAAFRRTDGDTVSVLAVADVSRV